MGKFKSWKYHNLFTSVATSTCLVGATAGLIFGVSAGTFKVEYMDLETAETRLSAAQGAYNYYSQYIGSEWNMAEDLNSHSKEITKEYWNKMHNNAEMLNEGDKYKLGDATKGLTDENIKNRYEYMSMVIDGSTHSTMDRSFNQGLYHGIVNFIKGKQVETVDPETENNPITKNCAHSFKPGADNTTEFLNIYAAVSKQFRTIGLAGFNHVSYLEAMGERDEDSGLFKFKNDDFWKTAYLLIDGNIEKNQNVASVLFRSDQPGWMAGMATCMYFLNNLNLYHDNYQDLAIGAYGGTAIPTVMIYLGGVQRGIEFFNNFILKGEIIQYEFDSWVSAKTDETKQYLEQTYDIGVVKSMIEHSKYKSEIEDLMAKYQAGQKTEEMENQLDELKTKVYDEYKIHMIKLGGGSTHFSGSFASGDAIGITKQFLNRGAGAIIAVAGPQSLDSAQEIKNQQSKCIVIGVDSAMEEGDYQRSQSTVDYADSTVAYGDGSKPANANNIIKFSAIKDITNVTSKFAELCAQNLNYDVEAQHKWEHITLPTKVEVSTASAEDKGEIEKQVMPDSVFDIENGVLTGVNKSIKTRAEREKYTICRIPEGVTSIGDGAFTGCFGPADEEATNNFPKVNRIVFNSSPTFHFGDEIFEGCFNINNLDFSNVSDPIRITTSPEEGCYSFGYNSFGGICDDESGNVRTGNIYLNDFLPRFSSAEKDTFVEWLKGIGYLNEKWFQINPDVSKSVCNIGYKTCGNIENGLISISWDGWQPFMQALQHLPQRLTVGKVQPDETTRYGGFMADWSNSLYNYVHESSEKEEELKKEMGSDYKTWIDAMGSLKSILSYNKDSVIKKYYSHTMKVLGHYLKDVQFPFTRDITIAKDQHGNLYTIPEGKVAQLSILDWLKLNMYFTC